MEARSIRGGLMSKSLQHQPVQLSLFPTEQTRSLPGAHIETAGAPEEIRDAVRKWVSWGIVSYPMTVSYRHGREARVNSEGELMSWAQTELRGRAQG